MRVMVMDIGFDSVDTAQAVETAMGYIRRREGCRVVTPNAEHALACKKDKRFLDVINTSQLVIPDGISVVIASKIIGKPVKQKVAGIEFAKALCAALAAEGRSLFILGGKPGVAEEAGRRLVAEHPGLTVAGTHDGFFEDGDAVARLVKQTGADVLFVALGAPKQELFMHSHPDIARVMIGLGGAVDIFAGNLRRAPDFYVNHGIEWLYRLIKEPKRIKRMIKLPLYLLDAVAFRITNREDTRG